MKNNLEQDIQIVGQMITPRFELSQYMNHQSRYSILDYLRYAIPAGVLTLLVFVFAAGSDSTVLAMTRMEMESEEIGAQIMQTQDEFEIATINLELDLMDVSSNN